MVHRSPWGRLRRICTCPPTFNKQHDFRSEPHASPPLRTGPPSVSLGSGAAGPLRNPLRRYRESSRDCNILFGYQRPLTSCAAPAGGTISAPNPAGLPNENRGTAAQIGGASARSSLLTMPGECRPGPGARSGLDRLTVLRQVSSSRLSPRTAPCRGRSPRMTGPLLLKKAPKRFYGFMRGVGVPADGSSSAHRSPRPSAPTDFAARLPPGRHSRNVPNSFA